MQISQYLHGRRNDGSIPTDFYWAINMPSQNDRDSSYSSALIMDNGDGLGNMLTGPYQPPIVTVHCYGYGTLCRTDADQPYEMIDYVRGWNPDINMKVTEAAINSNDPNRPAQYVEFAEKVATPRTDTKGGGGNLDSVCFYGLPLVEGNYNIDEVAADAIGSRAQSNYCG